jgi:hypothetical protein
VFYKDSRQVYRASELDALPWLIHGFGTRQSDIPAWFENLATVKQIHSATVVNAEGRCGILGEGDALLEDRPGAVIAVKTADCMPILLVDERHRAVAAVHAGWRGTVARIVAAAVDGMRARFGTLPGDLHAAIGPGIGKVLLPGRAGSGRPVRRAGKGAHLAPRRQSRPTAYGGRNAGADLRVELVHHVFGRGVSFVPPRWRGGGTIVLFRRDSSAR